jgi:ABC-type transport system substrate-binding protein
VIAKRLALLHEVVRQALRFAVIWEAGNEAAIIAELDTQKRRDMYREMQTLVHDDGGTIVPMYPNYIDARSEKIARAPVIASNYDLDGWKCIERWWAA